MTLYDGLPLPQPIAGGVKWRGYRDGVVVFVSSTCETHVLTPELAPVLRAGAAIRVPESPETAGPVTQVDPDRVLLAAPLFDELAGLHLFKSIR